MTTKVETSAQRRARITKRDKHRNSTCSGCRHNYYNFGKEQSPRGDVAVSEDYSCWFLDYIKRGKCSMKS
jgi:hypothetical protein